MINKAIIIGHVGQDPEVRYTGNVDNGTKVATIRVATTERYKGKDGKLNELTEWHSVVCWRQLADVVEKYVKKGTQIYVEGRIQSRSWEDDKGGKHYAVDIIANQLQLLGKREQSQPAADPYVAGAKTMAAKPAPAPMNDNPEDDLPF